MKKRDFNYFGVKFITIIISLLLGIILLLLFYILILVT